MSVFSGEIDITKLKKGDIYYEIEYGYAMKMVVEIPPCRDEDGLWKWIALNVKGREIEYLVNSQYAHYAPKLYYNIPYEGVKVI